MVCGLGWPPAPACCPQGVEKGSRELEGSPKKALEFWRGGR